MSWVEITEPRQRGELLAAAVGRAYRAKAAAERQDVPVPESAAGEIWCTDDGSATVWAIPREDEVVLADLHTTGQDPAAVWMLLDGLAAEAGWTGIWHFSSFSGDAFMTALAESADARRVATKMRVEVAEVPAPAGIRLHPMDDADYAAFRDASDEEYAQERFESGADPTIEAARRTTAEQMLELLPAGLQTPGNRFWTVRDDDDRRAGILWLHLRENLGFICDIAMDEDRRGQGLGTQTLRAAAEETARAGLDVLALNVFGSNPGARRLYEREGYRITESLWSVPIPRR